MRGSYAKGLLRRDEIVDAALELFTKMGYDRTSVREIARAVGLSQAGLLHHFRTKEELFTEVLRRRDDMGAERFYRPADGDVHTLDGLAQVVARNADEAGLVRLYVTMSAESTGDSSASHDFFTQRYNKLRGDIANDVRRRQALGTMSTAVEAERVATLLIAAADGLQLQWLLAPDQVDMGQLIDVLAQLFVGAPVKTQRANPRKR